MVVAHASLLLGFQPKRKTFSMLKYFLQYYTSIILRENFKLCFYYKKYWALYVCCLSNQWRICLKTNISISFGLSGIAEITYFTINHHQVCSFSWIVSIPLQFLMNAWNIIKTRNLVMIWSDLNQLDFLNVFFFFKGVSCLPRLHLFY